MSSHQPTPFPTALYSPLQCRTGSVCIQKYLQDLISTTSGRGPHCGLSTSHPNPDVPVLFLPASILQPALMCWIFSIVYLHCLHIGPCFWAFSAWFYAVFQSGLLQPYSHDTVLPFPDFSNRNCGIRSATHPRGHTSDVSMVVVSSRGVVSSPARCRSTIPFSIVAQYMCMRNLLLKSDYLCLHSFSLFILDCFQQSDEVKDPKSPFLVYLPSLCFEMFSSYNWDCVKRVRLPVQKGTPLFTMFSSVKASLFTVLHTF